VERLLISWPMLRCGWQPHNSRGFSGFSIDSALPKGLSEVPPPPGGTIVRRGPIVRDYENA
jgi:hypothetical protein